MSDLEFLLGLLLAVALLAQLARTVDVPYPIILVLGGLAVGFVPGLARIELEPEVIFLIFLPPLLVAAAWQSSPRQLRAEVRAITSLALGLVLVTTVLVAVLAHELIDLPWAAAFALGAIVAPTDPIAAEAVFKRIGVPERVSVMVGGESLVNDGSALVAYQLAVVAMVSGAFSLTGAGVEFVVVSGGGALLGLVLAWVVVRIWARVSDAAVSITLSLLWPYMAYILAEELHVSGILAVVVLGLYLGWNAPRLFTAELRLQSSAFWETLTFLLNALLFVLVGLQFPALLGSLEEYDDGAVLLSAVLVCLVVVGARFAWLWSAPYVQSALDRRGRYRRPSGRERIVIAWSGMRGAVSLAAALALPLQTDAGTPFPGRDLIIFLAFCAILATLVLQGLTLPTLIARLRFGDDGAGRRSELEARLAASRAALAEIDRICALENVSARSQERMRELYEDRIHHYGARLADVNGDGDHDDRSLAWRRWRRQLLGAEREALLALRNRGEITPEVMRRVERDLDLEETRFTG